MSLRLFWSAVLVLGFASSVFAAPQSADAQPQRASADRDQQVPADIDNEHPVSTVTKAPTLAVPRLVRFNGLLTTGPGQYSITFALYKDQQGGDALWQETRDVAVDATGHYSVMLGATQIQGIPVDVFANGEAKWLGIQVRGDAEQPRLLMVSVPYALKAEEADRLGGRSASDFLTKDEAQTTLKSAVQDAVNQAVSQTTARQDDTTATNNASIKITPGATQQGTTAAGAVKFTDTSANEVVLVQQSGTGVAVNAITSGTAGVQSTTTSSSGTGVYGTATAATGNAIGVRGDTAASNGQGVLGFAANAAGSGTGVQGTSAAATGTGVQGVAQGSSAIGVRATASGTAGANTGLLAETFSSTGTAGSFNATSASATLLSGKVNGATKFAVDGNGNITAAGGLSLAGPFNAGSFTGAAGNFSGSSPTQIITITQTGTGTAAVYNNTGGGAILSGLASGTEIFRVDQNPTGAVVLATQNAPGVANPSVTGPLPPAAIEGVSTSNSNISVAVMGIAHGNQSVGVLGINDSTVSPGNNNGTAVLAINENPTGKGVEVNMDDTTGTNTGVDVRLQSPNATGFNIDIPGGGTGSIFRAQAGPQGQQTTVFSIDNAGAIHFADGSTLSTANGAGGGSTFNGGTVSGPTTFQSLASFNAGASFNSAPATGSFSGSFSGDGSGLGNVNASALNGLPGTSFANLQSPNVFNALNTFNSGANFIGQVNATTLTTQQLSAQNIGDAGHGIFVSTTTDPQNGGNPILVQAGPGNGNGVGGSIQIAAGSGDGVSGNGGGSLVLLGGNGNNANNTAAVGGTVIIEAGSASAIGAAPSDIILAPGSVPTAAGPGVYGNVIIPQGGLQFPDGSVQTTAAGAGGGGSTTNVNFTGNNSFNATTGTAAAVETQDANAPALTATNFNGTAAHFEGYGTTPVVDIYSDASATALNVHNDSGPAAAFYSGNSSTPTATFDNPFGGTAATFSGDIFIDGSGNNASLNVMNPSGGDIFSAMNDASIEVFAVGSAEARVDPIDNAQNVATSGSGVSSFPLNINSLAYNSEFSSADPHTWSITASPVNGFPTSSDLNVDLDGKTVSYVFGGDGTLHAAAFQGDGSQLTGVAAANTANTFFQLNTFQGGISTTAVNAAAAPGSALSVQATAGLLGTNSNGGDLNLNAGGADLNDGFSGHVNINAGSGNTGGNVNITAGHGRAGNSAGNIYLNVGQNDNGDLGQVLVNGGLVTNNPTGVGAAISATGKDVAGFGEPVHLVGDVNGQAFSSANGDTLGRIVRFEQINNPFVDGTVSGTFGSSRADLGFDQNGNFFITRDLSNATPAISVDVNNNVTIAGLSTANIARTDQPNFFSVANSTAGLAVNQAGNGAAFLANSVAGGPVFVGQNNGTTTSSIDNFGNVTGLSGVFAGFQGGVLGQDTATGATGGNVGVQGIVDSTDGSGVFGNARSLTGPTNGVFGKSKSSNGAGVFGLANSTTGVTAGMRGVSFSPQGKGVEGDSQAGATNNTAIGNGVGVLGTYGTNQDFSVNTAATNGYGIVAQNHAPGGVPVGLQAEVDSAAGLPAVLINHSGSGRLLTGGSNSNQTFSIYTDGSASFNNNVTAGGLLQAGNISVPAIGSPSGAFAETPSGAFDLVAASNDSGSNPHTDFYRWQNAPAGTFCDGACQLRLTLLHGTDQNAPTPILSINPDGTINFAPNQSFAGTGAASTTSQNTFNDTQTFNQAQFGGPAVVVNDTFGGTAALINHTGSSGVGLRINSDTEPLMLTNTANGGGFLMAAFSTDSSLNQFQVLNIDGTQNTCGGNQDPFSSRCGLVALPALGFADSTNTGYTSATLQLEGSYFDGSQGNTVEWNVSADPVNPGTFAGDVALNFHRAFNTPNIPNNPLSNTQLIMSLTNGGVSIGGGTPIKTILLGSVSYTTSSTFSAGCDAGVSVVIPGAAPGDVVSLGLPPSLATDQFTIFKAWVTNNTDTNGNFFVNVSGCHFAAGSGSPTTDTINLQVTHFAPPTA